MYANAYGVSQRTTMVTSQNAPRHPREEKQYHGTAIGRNRPHRNPKSKQGVLFWRRASATSQSRHNSDQPTEDKLSNSLDGDISLTGYVARRTARAIENSNRGAKGWKTNLPIFHSPDRKLPPQCGPTHSIISLGMTNVNHRLLPFVMMQIEQNDSKIPA